MTLKTPALIEVSVRGLNKSFGSLRALKDLSIDFQSGALNGVVGPNGAGKTTLLRILMGLLYPDGERKLKAGGSSLPDGASAVAFFEKGKRLSLSAVRPRMAYFPQEQSLYPDLTCAEHMRFFADLYQLGKKEYQERSAELFRLTRLEQFRDRKAGKLSGGMYKKLGLMCVLLHSPDILLLDEPTIGVDPVSRRELWELMYRFVGASMTIIMSTSYMDEAERCGKVFLLDEGRLLLAGEPGGILKEEKAEKFEEIFLRRTGPANAKQ
ncbi:MAG: ABC transporter ATP-binding protein [Elusimicrobiaceae bacterium]